MVEVIDLSGRAKSKMKGGNLPTFICIGAMKCGTTSLHRYLDAHPDVCMSSPKETDFFLQRNSHDPDWYRQRFSQPAQAYGETSPNYTKRPGFKGVPEQMHRLLPDIKLLYLVRDPVERAISHYVHNQAARRENDSVEKALYPPGESWYVNVSRYHYQISQYLEYYSWENICVIESERLRNERMKTVAEIFEFIGVKPDVTEEQVRPEHHKSEEKQRTTGAVEFLIHTNVGRTLKSIGKAIVPSSLVEHGKELLWRDARKPKVSQEIRGCVREFLKEDVEQLRRLTGNEFASWSL